MVYAVCPSQHARCRINTDMEAWRTTPVGEDPVSGPVSLGLRSLGRPHHLVPRSILLALLVTATAGNVRPEPSDGAAQDQQSASQPTVKELQDELNAADQLYNKQRWDEAIAAYRAILVRGPGLTAVNLQIAGAYRHKGEFDRAIDSYTALLRSDPGNNHARIGIAMTTLEKGDLESAERALEIAAHAPGATREVFYNLAELKLSKSKVDDARKAYERAAEIDPKWTRPALGMGRLAMRNGDKQTATKYFEKVIALDPASTEAAQAGAALEQLKK
jgi:tetratricopeptide (TPR) repeat protein